VTVAQDLEITRFIFFLDVQYGFLPSAPLESPSHNSQVQDSALLRTRDISSVVGSFESRRQ
jgi:hypothetical protein